MNRARSFFFFEENRFNRKRFNDYNQKCLQVIFLPDLNFHVVVRRRQVHRLALLLLPQVHFFRPGVPNVDLCATLALRFELLQVGHHVAQKFGFLAGKIAQF